MPKKRMKRHAIDQPPVQSTTFIYALCDPDTREIRYVGKADEPKVRFTRHFLNQELFAETHKARWIRNLLAVGKKPILHILCQAPSDNWQPVERHWIATLRNQGCKLTNTTEGGDGRPRGWKHALQAKQKIIKALRGRPVSQETRDKIRRTQIGRKFSDEHIEKLSKAHLKRWASLPEQERMIAIARLNREWTPERRAKLSKAHRGKKPNRKTSAPYLGAAFFKRDKNWRAYLYVSGKQIHLGYFSTPQEAARAYDEAAIKHFGEFAVLNFPRE